jgi:hypothetical protein
MVLLIILSFVVIAALVLTVLLRLVFVLPLSAVMLLLLPLALLLVLLFDKLAHQLLDHIVFLTAIVVLGLVVFMLVA